MGFGMYSVASPCCSVLTIRVGIDCCGRSIVGSGYLFGKNKLLKSAVSSGGFMDFRVPDVSGLYTVRYDAGDAGIFNIDVQHTPERWQTNPVRAAFPTYNEVASSSNFSFGKACCAGCLFPTNGLSLSLNFNWPATHLAWDLGHPGDDTTEWPVWTDSLNLNLTFNPSGEYFASQPTLVGDFVWNEPQGGPPDPGSPIVPLCAVNEYLTYTTYFLSCSGCQATLSSSSQVIWAGTPDAPCVCKPSFDAYDGSEGSVARCYSNPVFFTVVDNGWVPLGGFHFSARAGNLTQGGNVCLPISGGFSSDLVAFFNAGFPFVWTSGRFLLS